MMLKHLDLSSIELKILIKNNEIRFGGNSRLKIYGLLGCSSGKRMKRENRVFFKTENDALAMGFRPCGHCLRQKYNQWIYLTKK